MWIKRGSRPLYVTDNDESVLCSMNEFQSRCNATTDKVFKYSCVEFRNASDSGLFWYQKIQQDSIFVPSTFAYRFANLNGECPSFEVVNFYIDEVNQLSVKSVATDRGEGLGYFQNPGVVNVCYRTPETYAYYVRPLLTRFIQCLSLYGDGLNWISD